MLEEEGGAGHDRLDIGQLARPEEVLLREVLQEVAARLVNFVLLQQCEAVPKPTQDGHVAVDVAVDHAGEDDFARRVDALPRLAGERALAYRGKPSVRHADGADERPAAGLHRDDDAVFKFQIKHATPAFQWRKRRGTRGSPAAPVLWFV